jgi:hypothetical protein
MSPLLVHVSGVGFVDESAASRRQHTLKVFTHSTGNVTQRAKPPHPDR